MRSRLQIWAITLAVLVLSCIRPGNAVTDLVTNGNFNSPSISNWVYNITATSWSGNIYCLVSVGTSEGWYSGWSASWGQAVVLSPGATITQSIPTIAGQIYQLSFDTCADNTAGAQIQASLGGSVFGTWTLGATNVNGGIVNATASIVAPTNGAILTFGSLAQYPVIGNVTVTGPAEPTPETGLPALYLGALSFVWLDLRTRGRKRPLTP